MLHYKISDYYATVALKDECIFGVEYEIEDLKKIELPKNKYGFVREADNSLRNSGFEFKTGPLAYEDAIGAFNWLHKTIQYGPLAFSERTSIHVHMNIGNFNFVEAKNLVLAYALLEPFFFDFVGESRKSSIYCVPLNYTTLPNYYHKTFDKLIDLPWHKYTAFNILPAKDFGTVEFRHLEGTNDLERFTKWLTGIKGLHDKVHVVQFNPTNILSDKRKTIDFARETVPVFTNHLTNDKIGEMMYDSILDVKLAVEGIR